MKPDTAFLSAWYRPQVMAALKVVLQRHDTVTMEDVCGPSRLAAVCAVRHECAWVLRHLGFSLQDIARVLRRTDHATALHSLTIISETARLDHRTEAAFVSTLVAAQAAALKAANDLLEKADAALRARRRGPRRRAVRMIPH
jgi:hypothetical protein